jgi:hypothetical protein
MIDAVCNQSRCRNMQQRTMVQRNFEPESDPPAALDPTMMRRRATDKDPSGTVEVLRWVAVFGPLLPVILLAGIAWMERSDILTSSERDGTKIVALFREQAGNLFTGHEIILDMVVNRMRDMRHRSRIQFTDLLRELEVIDKRLDDASEIVLVDAEGAVLASTARARPDQPQSEPDQKCFLVLSKNEAASCISQPHIDARTGAQLFSLSKRMEQGGTFSGIAQVAISADYIVNLWASSAPGESDIVTMFTSDGTVLAQSGSGPQARPSLPDVGKTLIGKIGQSGAGIIRAPLTPNGIDRITVYSMLAEHPVYVSLSLAKHEILKKWHITLVIYGLIAGSFVAGFVIALGIALRRTHVFNSLLAANRRR